MAKAPIVKHTESDLKCSERATKAFKDLGAATIKIQRITVDLDTQKEIVEAAKVVLMEECPQFFTPGTTHEIHVPCAGYGTVVVIMQVTKGTEVILMESLDAEQQEAVQRWYITQYSISKADAAKVKSMTGVDLSEHIVLDESKVAKKINAVVVKD